MITFDEFKKMQLIVAQIKKVENHPNADRLYVIEIDTGSSTKRVVAGIKPYYTPQELIGKFVVLLDNLQPTNIRGVESQGMILAASDENGISVLTLDKPAKIGSTIK